MEQREQVIRDFGEYQKDLEAFSRVAKKQGKKLSQEEKEEIFQSYKSLQFVNEEYKGDLRYRASNFIWLMNQNMEFVKSGELDSNSILINEIIWDDEHLEIILGICKRFGYKNIHYTNSSV